MSDFRKNSEIKKFFEKKLLEIERVDALDAAIDLSVDLSREKILVHIYEVSSLVKKEHFFELKGCETIGSSSVKSNHFVLDSQVDEVHFSLEYDGNHLNATCLSDIGMTVIKKGAVSTKSYKLKRDSSLPIKNNDMILIGSTRLIFEVFSNKIGLINKDK